MCPTILFALSCVFGLGACGGDDAIGGDAGVGCHDSAAGRAETPDAGQEPVDSSGGTFCASPSSWGYESPGCAADAKLVCHAPSADAAAIGIYYCGCNGHTITGGIGVAPEPYRFQGCCPGDSGFGPLGSYACPLDGGLPHLVPSQDGGATTGAEAGSSPRATLATGVEQAALAAVVRPEVVQFIQATQPGADSSSIELGRPWAQFELHKGPRLVFLGSWRMLVSVGGNPIAVVDANRDGNSYRMTGIGSAVFVPTMVAREAMSSVSAALDRGRAALLRCLGDGGDSLLAYETEPLVDAGQAEIRVQPLGASDRRFQGKDVGPNGSPEMSLAELDSFLPAE